MKSALSVVFVLFPAAHLAAQCIPGWQPSRQHLDLNRVVHFATPWDPDGPGPEPELLTLCGQATLAGTTQINQLGAWDGNAYRAFGSGLPFQSGKWVWATCVYQGELYAIGSFSPPAPGNGVIRWTGSQWVQAGQGLVGSVEAAAVHQGELFVTGQFKLGSSGVTTVAAWNGSSWRIVGVPPNGWGYAIASTPEGLVIGGNFSIGKAARWTGSNWSAIGSPLGVGTIGSLAWHDGRLYAGGHVQLPGGSFAHLLALEGNSWSEVPGILPVQPESNTYVYALREYGGVLHIGGRFALADGTYSIARLENGAAMGIGEGLGDSKSGVVYGMAGYRGHLHAVGSFRSNGHERFGRIARLTGDTWERLTDGNNGSVHFLVSHQGHLYAAGDFLRLEGVNSHGIMRREGGTWIALPPIPNTTAPMFQVGVSFNDVLAVVNSYQHVHLWDGFGWTTLPSPGFTINDLAVFENSLIAAGNGVVRFDGASWVPLQGTTGLTKGTVDRLLVREGVLYASGDFKEADGAPSNPVAHWDGASWQSVGPPVPAMMAAADAMIAFDGKLIAAVGAGNPRKENIIAWDGTSWSQLGTNPPAATGFAVVKGELLAASGGVWSFDGASWTPEAQVDGPVRAIHFHEPESTLYVGGDFFQLNGQPSVALARRICPACYANCDNSSATPILNAADFSCFLTKFAARDPYANCDQSTAPPTLNVADFACFLTRFAQGCP